MPEEWMPEKLVEEIKARGYWRIEIRPVNYIERRLLGGNDIKKVVSTARVLLRGWPYPYYNPAESLYNGKWLDGKSDWQGYKEYWRLYESGQWIHLLSTGVAWVPGEESLKYQSSLPRMHSGYVHYRDDILFTLTEVFRFASNLAQFDSLGEDFMISTQLHNTKDYMLYESSGRVSPPFFINQSDVPITWECTLSKSDLLSTSTDKALENALKIYSAFGWDPVLQNE